MSRVKNEHLLDHPQVHPDFEIIHVFDCAQCSKTFRLRAAFVRDDGALLCGSCMYESDGRYYDYAKPRYTQARWCPGCKRALPFTQFAARDERRRARLCVECEPPAGPAEPVAARTCRVCGAEIVDKRSDARTCSTACRVAAHRARATHDSGK